MKKLRVPLVRRFLQSELGQTAAVVVLSASSVMAVAGASLESGHVYYAYQQLRASTNAATLAGAQGMPNTSQATSNVTLYSSQSGQLNASPWLQSVVATPTFLCSSGVSTNLNVACETSTGASGGYNAISVTQTAKVKLWFGGLIGIQNVNLSATAEAAMAGGANEPWNIAIILDATPSMNYQDSGAQCSGTQLSCAKQGIQALLNDLYPCALGVTCNSTNPIPPAVDSVNLLVFPAVTAGTASDDYTCNGSPSPVAYTFSDVTTAYVPGTMPTAKLMLPSGDTYQIIGFANDYKTTDTASSLNKSSDVVIAAGAGPTGRGTCGGISSRNQWTYYAEVIYAAQGYLAAQQTANPGSKNAIILLSDGDATATAANAYTAGGASNNSPIAMIAGVGTLNGTGSKTTNPNGYNNPTYPSAIGQCGQAVLAAQYAANSGTTVYTIGYGSPTSGSCNTDHTYSASVTTNGGTWGAGKQGCDALAAMASSATNFYSDDGSGCQASAPSNQNITKLTDIFHRITKTLETPRLVPLGT